MYIIGVEGLIRAGKSTLVNWLSAELSAPIVEEYGEYIKRSGTSFPIFPPTSYKAAIAASQKFIGIEQQRLLSLDSVGKAKIVLIDRTYLSCVGFDYAARHFTGFDTFEEVEHLWRASPKIEPDLTFFLDVSQGKLEERVLPHRHLYLPHFCDADFNKHITEFLHHKASRDKGIIHISADQSQDEVKHQALQYIKKFNN